MEPAAQPAQQEPINVAQAYAMAQVCLDLHDALGCKWGDNPYLAIDRLKTAAPVQEPVAWRVRFHYGTDGMAKRIGDWKLYGYSPTPEEDKEIEPLYTTPPQNHV
jgi:hypothetical protein